MAIIQEKKFQRKDEELKRQMVTVPIDTWFTTGELEQGKELLQQPQNATCIKQLAKIGLIVLQSKEMSAILGAILGNRRRNKRKGIVEYE